VRTGVPRGRLREERAAGTGTAKGHMPNLPSHQTLPTRRGLATAAKTHQLPDVALVLGGPRRLLGWGKYVLPPDLVQAEDLLVHMDDVIKVGERKRRHICIRHIGLY